MFLFVPPSLVQCFSTFSSFVKGVEPNQLETFSKLFHKSEDATSVRVRFARNFFLNFAPSKILFYSPLFQCFCPFSVFQMNFLSNVKELLVRFYVVSVKIKKYSECSFISKQGTFTSITKKSNISQKLNML